MVPSTTRLLEGYLYEFRIRSKEDSSRKGGDRQENESVKLW